MTFNSLYVSLDANFKFYSIYIYNKLFQFSCMKLCVFTCILFYRKFHGMTKHYVFYSACANVL